MPVREADLNDLQDVVRISLESLDFGPYKEIVKRSPQHAEALVNRLLTGTDGVVLVSETNGNIDGVFAFIVFPHFYSGEMTAGELIWYVTAEARTMHSFGDSIAFDLLSAGEKKAAKMGAKVMQLGAPSELVGKLYQRRGYTQVEVTYRREITCPLQLA